MRREIAYLAVGVFTLGALALGGLTLLYSWKVKPTIEAARLVQEKYFESYQDDLKFLSKRDELNKSELLNQIKLLSGAKSSNSKQVPRDAQQSDASSSSTLALGKDASELLNSRVFWSPRGADTPGAPLPLVPLSVREELLRMRGDWIQQATKAKRLSADLSIFSDINKYDFWDIETGDSPIRSLSERGEFVPPPRLPIPEPGDLIAASKLYLMKATFSGDFLSALKGTRKLAQLLLTTENLQLMITGIAILDHERRAYRHFVDDHGFGSERWQPIDRNTTRRAARAVLATRGFLRLWTKPEILNPIFLSSNLPPGFCAAVNEAFPLENSLRRLLQPRWPLEMDLRQEYSRLDQIFQRAKENCRIRYLSRLVETNHFTTAIPGPVLLSRLPYSRKVFGMRLSGVSVGGFEAYQQPQSDTSNNSDSGR